MKGSCEDGLGPHLPVRTPRLLIRPFRLHDADALYELHRSPQVTRYAGGTKTREESKSALIRIMERVKSTGFGALALEEQDSRQVIGWCGIQQMRDFDEYEVLYALVVRKWGYGLAYEGASALMTLAFDVERIRIDRIFGLVYPQNVRSIRVLEKLGMRFVRNHYDEASGKHACLYTASRIQFLERQSSLSK